MVKLNSIVRFLNKELNVRDIKDKSKNGLQVKGRNEVKKIAFGVDACMELFEKAKSKKCDLIVVHHGLLWEGKGTDILLKKRISYLKKNKIGLYGVHLPLDRHPEYGNNAELCKLLELDNVKGYGKYHGLTIGCVGDKMIKLRSFLNLINKKLKTKSKLWKYGKDKIRKIGVVSGRGDSMIPEYVGKVDCFLTGEIKHDNTNLGKEGKLNLIAAGHYATETLGVKALMRLLKEKFNIETVFIDIPTGM